MVTPGNYNPTKSVSPFTLKCEIPEFRYLGNTYSHPEGAGWFFFTLFFFFDNAYCILHFMNMVNLKEKIIPNGSRTFQSAFSLQGALKADATDERRNGKTRKRQSRAALL